MENYMDLKARVFQNSNESSWVVLGYDDPISRGAYTRAKERYFILAELKF